MTVIETKGSQYSIGFPHATYKFPLPRLDTMPETPHKANDQQVGGTHYKAMPIEHWDLVALFGWDYFQAQITRYMMRWRDKDGIKDLEKMVHVAQKYLEIEKLRANGNLTWDLLKAAMDKLRVELHLGAEPTQFRNQGEVDTSVYAAERAIGEVMTVVRTSEECSICGVKYLHGKQQCNCNAGAMWSEPEARAIAPENPQAVDKPYPATHAQAGGAQAAGDVGMHPSGRPLAKPYCALGPGLGDR